MVIVCRPRSGMGSTRCATPEGKVRYGRSPVLAVELRVHGEPSGGFAVRALHQRICHHTLALAGLRSVQGGL